MVLAVAQSARARLRAAVRRRAAADQDRDDAIVEMRRDENATLLDIATVADMSIEGVRKILHKRGLR